MNRRTSTVVIALVLGLGLLARQAAAVDFVEFCHVPEGNPENKILITTAEEAYIHGHYKETSSLDTMDLTECSTATVEPTATQALPTLEPSPTEPVPTATATLAPTPTQDPASLPPAGDTPPADQPPAT